jgi:hypothetical protein
VLLLIALTQVLIPTVNMPANIIEWVVISQNNLEAPGVQELDDPLPRAVFFGLAAVGSEVMACYANETNRLNNVVHTLDGVCLPTLDVHLQEIDARYTLELANFIQTPAGNLPGWVLPSSQGNRAGKTMILILNVDHSGLVDHGTLNRCRVFELIPSAQLRELQERRWVGLQCQHATQLANGMGEAQDILTLASTRVDDHISLTRLV